MSHVVKIQTKIRDRQALVAACQRLGLAAPVTGAARLFSAEVVGELVQLPGWKYPVVIDLAQGEVQFDNFQGHWGETKELDRLLQMYAVEKTRSEARQKGFSVTERPLADGSICVQIVTA